MKRTPIRKRSAKMERIYASERRPLVEKLLTENPICKKCKSNKSQDIHELKSRARGGSITDPDNCVALCRSCHIWITTHPKEAAQQGWLRYSWE
jgi:5-methylcytosine-specific restriction endonuclease McrA